ncbi:MAG: glycerol-3-phosphate dehydrogenase/oxidase [Chromatiaceae bacterium]|nr:glycerol-3-phosphate dehydrogenase/oxidase [Gammaproteobacteria bacterium]MCP5298226.1 glycerol-3-phosphate dehydrogenase/oxidase [Chromatiaceae bacterium]MCP5423234.1 glycerol-3-phosphate dehydrogenase/oxidase [Chromatiaceae bacterium]
MSTTVPLAGSLAREASLQRLRETARFDVLVIGGGATGLGVALEAATRGLAVALVERDDFAKGTSSRATKLVHGGVRYLAQGNIHLVREALRERRALLSNAPHLAQPLPFVVPAFGLRGRVWDRLFYGTGLKLYDLLAGSAGLADTEFLDRAGTVDAVPGVCVDELVGSVRYWDGQFDDARTAIALARTAASHGAVVINHCAVRALLHVDGRISGASLADAETGEGIDVHADCVVNATGVWVDELRRLDVHPESHMVSPSQGIHLVVDRDFLPGDHALLVPKTADGRVMFAVPWMGKVLLGTTDTPRDTIESEPTPLIDEVDFILGEARKYLARAPSAGDVRSIWGGVRPLVRPPDAGVGDTKDISREHVIVVDESGMVTVTGGKWTTYRAMAEDVIDRCDRAGLVTPRLPSCTLDLPLVGAPAKATHKISDPPGAHLYGTDAQVLDGLPGSARELGMGLSEAMVRFAVRYEAARTVEDVLARRARILFLDAALADALADEVASIVAEELGHEPGDLARFKALAQRYRTLPA